MNSTDERGLVSCLLKNGSESWCVNAVCVVESFSVDIGVGYMSIE